MPDAIGEEHAGAATVGLMRVPVSGTDAVYVNGLRLNRVGAFPAQNEYTIAANTVTFGGTAPTAADLVLADYAFTLAANDAVGILQLVQSLSLDQTDADADTANPAYVALLDTIAELGGREILVEHDFSFVIDSAGPDITLDNLDLLRLLAVFWDDRQLDPLTTREAEWLRPTWRTDRGSPVAFVRDEETDTTIRLTPRPDMPIRSVNSSATTSYDIGAIWIDRPLVLPQWLVLPVALRVAAREFRRESAFRDVEVADAYDAVAQQLFELCLPPNDTGG